MHNTESMASKVAKRNGMPSIRTLVFSLESLPSTITILGSDGSEYVSSMSGIWRFAKSMLYM